MKRVTIFLFIMGLLAGCHRVESPSLVLPGEVVEVSASFVVASDGDTKGVNDPESISSPADVIKNLWIVQYNGTDDDAKVLGEPTYIRDFSTFDGSVNLVATAGKSSIYFVANTFESEGEFPVYKGSTIADLKRYKRQIRTEMDLFSAGDSDDFHLIFNGYQEFDKIDGETVINGELKRNLAKLNIDVVNQASAGDGLKIRAVQLMSVPSVSYYVTSVPEVVAPFPSTKDFTKLNYAEVPWNEGEDQMNIVSYVPVNMRGKDLKSDSESLKNKYAPDGSTYLLVSATYQDDGRDYPITYTFYLGENMTNDYNLAPNNSYHYTFVIKSKGDADSDYRISDWGVVDFTDEDKYPLSNCYILNPMPSGTDMRSFRIPIKRAIEFWGDGSSEPKYENDVDYSFRNNAEWRCYILASDFVIDPSKFRIVKDHGKSGDDPYFEVTVAPGVRGNVIVGVGHTKDATRSISWSWHLWITDYDPSSALQLGEGEWGIYPVTNGSVHRYKGTFWNSNTSAYIMDRNLGSFSPEVYPVDNFGLVYYQYGRKDPFFQKNLYKYPEGATLKFATVDYSEANEVSGNGMAYSVNNPLSIIKGGAESGETYTWLKSGDKYSPLPFKSSIMWHDPYADADSKSIFDPCPPGYRVPPRNVWSDFVAQGSVGNESITSRNNKPTTNAFTSNGNYLLKPEDYTRGFRPFDELKGLQYWPWSDANPDIPQQVVYIPASGYLHQTSGAISNHGNSSSEKWSFLWAETASSQYSGYGYTAQPNHLSASNTTHRSRGLPVRCVTDNRQ